MSARMTPKQPDQEDAFFRVWTFLTPLLYAAFPVLSLLATNIEVTSPRFALRPAAVLILVTAVLQGIARARGARPEAASAVLSVSLLLAFAYGHVAGLLARGLSAPPLVAIGLWLAIPVCGMAILRLRNLLRPLAQLLAVAGVISLVFPSLRILRLEWGLHRAANRASAASVQNVSQLAPSAESLPDIYYIVLDGYGREDVLRDLYHFDNSEFLRALEKRGFAVLGRSVSNYAQTSLSLASSLNMAYLSSAALGASVESDSQEQLASLIRSSQVRASLEDLGYASVAFSTGYRRTEMESAGVYLPAPIRAWTPFEGLLVETSVLWPIVEFAQHAGLIAYPGYQADRDQIQFILTQLESMPASDQPRFVFAHVVAPHPPFVFLADGDSASPTSPFRLQDGNEFLGTPNEYVSGYIQQLQYINRSVLTVVDAIIASTDGNVIIVLQGDHGPGSRLDWEDPVGSDLFERMSILNAIRLPSDEQAGEIPSSLSPVNTFRLIFNRQFGGEYELLEEQSFFSTWHRPFAFYEYHQDD